MINKHYIPLGFQCTVPTVLQHMGSKTETLPFDWMLSSLLTGMPIPELVTEHFFKCTAKSRILIDSNNSAVVEHYITDPSGEALYNEQYDVIFPHDVYDEDHITKYIRRFERLYNLIKTGENLIYVYISPSSIHQGNFIIDDRSIINDTTKYLIDTYELLKNHTGDKNFEFKVLTTFNDSIEYPGIQFVNITPQPVWLNIVSECVDTLRHP
jgi:hypothetical protein